jgi:tRNA(Ser,Leu) C12 N-acetylase TAN1
MHDWNVVVTVQAEGFAAAWPLLAPMGEVDKSDYFNVLLMRVPETTLLLQTLTEHMAAEPGLQRVLSRVMPVSTTFDFQDPSGFEEQARQAVRPWLADLVGKRFHVRMHRRGFRGRLSSQQEERFLDHYLLEQLAAQGDTASIDFDDPDVIIALETVGQRAGLSCWSREDRRRFPLLKLD